MGIFNVVHPNDSALPVRIRHVLLNVRLAIAALVRRNYSDEVFGGASFGAERSGRRILKQELFDAAAGIFSCEFSFVLFISRCVKDDSLFVGDIICCSPFAAYLFNALFAVRAEEVLAHVHFTSVFTNEMRQVSIALVNVPHCFVASVLANIVRRELVELLSILQWHGIVHIVHVLFSPGAEITHEPVQVVALRHRNRSILVELFYFIHQNERHVFVVDV